MSYSVSIKNLLLLILYLTIISGQPEENETKHKTVTPNGKENKGSNERINLLKSIAASVAKEEDIPKPPAKADGHNILEKPAETSNFLAKLLNYSNAYIKEPRDRPDSGFEFGKNMDHFINIAPFNAPKMIPSDSVVSTTQNEMENKTSAIEALQKEKSDLVKRILDSVDKVVANTKNNSDEQSLQKIKNIIKSISVLDDYSKEMNGLTKLPQGNRGLSGIIPKLEIGRRYFSDEKPNELSPEWVPPPKPYDKFGLPINFKHRAQTERPKDIAKEKKKRLKWRAKFQVTLDEWLKDRQKRKETLPTYPTPKPFREQCEPDGWTRTKVGDILIRPCCLHCCRRSYMGCGGAGGGKG